MQPTQNQIFCFLLPLNVFNTVHLWNGDIWLQLVESFSNMGLHLSGKLLTVDPSRGTRLPNDTLKQYKPLKRNTSHNLSPSHIVFSGCLRNRYCLNRTINSESSCLLTDEHGKLKFNWSAQQASKGVRDWEEAGRGGWFDLIPWDKYRNETGKPPQSLIPWQNFSGQRKLIGRSLRENYLS